MTRAFDDHLPSEASPAGDGTGPAGGAATGPLASWAAQLRAWAIPPEILASAEESPWVLPTEVFAQRAHVRINEPGGPSYERALEVLDAGATVLDVGAGGGAAGLPLARARQAHLIAVDEQPVMLEALRANALAAGVEVELIAGNWPAVAADTPVADVVVCHHVLYNVADLAPFVIALGDHARRRVVTEMTELHPLTNLNPLWERFYGSRRPTGPGVEDAVAALEELGIDVHTERFQMPSTQDYQHFEALVDVTRRRLCLPASRTAEVASALEELGGDPTRPTEPGFRDLATLWWDSTAA